MNESHYLLIKANYCFFSFWPDACCWNSISALVEVWVLEVENDNEEDRKVTKLLATIIHSQSTWDPNTPVPPKSAFIMCLWRGSKHFFVVLE